MMDVGANHAPRQKEGIMALTFRPEVKIFDPITSEWVPMVKTKDFWTPAELEQLAQWAGEDSILRFMADKPAI